MEIIQVGVDFFFGDFQIDFRFLEHDFRIENHFCDIHLSGQCPEPIFEDLLRCLQTSGPFRWPRWVLRKLAGKLCAL